MFFLNSIVVLFSFMLIADAVPAELQPRMWIQVLEFVFCVLLTPWWTSQRQCPVGVEEN